MMQGKTHPQLPAEPGLRRPAISGRRGVAGQAAAACCMQRASRAGQRCRSCAMPSPGLWGSPTHWERELLLAARCQDEPRWQADKAALTKGSGLRGGCAVGEDLLWPWVARSTASPAPPVVTVPVPRVPGGTCSAVHRQSQREGDPGTPLPGSAPRADGPSPHPAPDGSLPTPLGQRGAK